MNRQNFTRIKNGINSYQLGYRSIIHEAGQATGIYLLNQRHPAPATHFDVIISTLVDDVAKIKNNASTIHDPHNCADNTNLLLPSDGLPKAVNEETYNQTQFDIETQSAEYASISSETDIVNLLIGPLAEVRFVAICDDELFDRRLLTLESLRFYDASLELSLVQRYLQDTIICPMVRDQKGAELLSRAFRFVNDNDNWKLIQALAQYMFYNNRKVTEYAEISEIIEQEFSH